MYYLKRFQTDVDYQSFKGGVEYIEPNVSAIIENNEIKYNGLIKKIITFLFRDSEYMAKEGMTWEQFVNSEYNTIGLYISDNILYAPGDYRIYNIKDFYNNVNITDYIIENESYDTSSMTDLG